ncbi:hypothetical protein D9615_000474 [Tricholomella constricta]|uniref:Uncharacterized protein n=1 Tax=Tricholomella constricta TaxID=117010 RepID=A0A8H5HQR9_9AGAR|nr:hypothetical protein D9615_000474 [Tricholomella constricta]
MDISELAAQPRSARTLSFYVVFICLVVPVWSMIPFSWLFVIYTIASGRIWSISWFNLISFVAALCEVLFSIYHYQLSRHVSRPASFAPGDMREIQAAFKRLLQSGLAYIPEDGGDEESHRQGSPEEDIIQLEFDDPRAIDFRNAMRTWFGNVPWSSVNRHQVRQWLYWSIYNADLPTHDTLLASQKVVLDLALELLQKRCGCTFKDNLNPAKLTMRVTLDEVDIRWRPFFFYTTLQFINSSLKRWYKVRWNVRFGHYDGLEYLIRVPKHWDPVTSPRPIIFIHGLGLGLLQYNSVIRHLIEQFSDRPMLILLQPQISQHIFHPDFLKPMTRHETADRLAGLISYLGWVHYDIDEKWTSDDSEEEKEISHSLLDKRKKGVTMLSHSNGSYTHAWVLKGHPKLVGRSCFIDPVTFCSWEGDVCFNFLYRQPRTGLELLMRYFVATELGVSNVIRRHFDWVSNTLWFEEIPNAHDPSKAFFLLGGKDSIVHSERVKRYLTSHGVKQGLWYDPDGSHGQALLPGSRSHLEILRWVGEADS